MVHRLEVFLVIIVSVTAITSDFLLVHFRMYYKSAEILFKEQTLMWNVEKDLFLFAVFND